MYLKFIIIAIALLIVCEGHTQVYNQLDDTYLYIEYIEDDVPILFDYYSILCNKQEIKDNKIKLINEEAGILFTDVKFNTEGLKETEKCYCLDGNCGYEIKYFYQENILEKYEYTNCFKDSSNVSFKYNELGLLIENNIKENSEETQIYQYIYDNAQKLSQISKYLYGNIEFKYNFIYEDSSITVKKNDIQLYKWIYGNGKISVCYEDTTNAVYYEYYGDTCIVQARKNLINKNWSSLLRIFEDGYLKYLYIQPYNQPFILYQYYYNEKNLISKIFTSYNNFTTYYKYFYYED